MKERQARNYNRTKRAKALPELKEGDKVRVKVGLGNSGTQREIKYKAEEPNSYWVEVRNRLVRRNRKHFRLLYGEQEKAKEQKASVAFNRLRQNITSWRDRDFLYY